jgi:hypothetical protein
MEWEINKNENCIPPKLKSDVFGILKTNTVSLFAQPNNSAYNNENVGTTIVKTEPAWMVH